MKQSISIAGRPIGQQQKPFIIAEMSGNHNQSLDYAMAIVEAVLASGADAADTTTRAIHRGTALHWELIDGVNSRFRKECHAD